MVQKEIYKNSVGIFIIIILCQYVCSQTWSAWSRCSSSCRQSRTCLENSCSGASTMVCYEPNCPDRDDCGSSPCRRGRCYDGEYEYVCDCSGTGYTGQTCEDPVDECLSNPCLNGGTCYDMSKHYLCDCPDEQSNYRCEPYECSDRYCTYCPVGADVCSTCVDSTRLAGDRSCEVCIENCLECPYITTVCTSCDVNYGLTFAGRCEVCETEDCSECDYDPSTCRVCMSGYNLIGGICEVCQINQCNLGSRMTGCNPMLMTVLLLLMVKSIE